jgi:hypothetical protein
MLVKLLPDANKLHTILLGSMIHTRSDTGCVLTRRVAWIAAGSDERPSEFPTRF